MIKLLWKYLIVSYKQPKNMFDMMVANYTSSNTALKTNLKHRLQTREAMKKWYLRTLVLRYFNSKTRK